MIKHTNTNHLIWLGFWSLLLLMLPVIIISYYQLNQFTASLEKIVKENNVKTTLSIELLTTVKDRSFTLLRMLNTEDPIDLDHERYVRMTMLANRFLKARRQLLKMTLSEEEKEALNRQNEMTKVATVDQIRVGDLLVLGKKEEAMELLYSKALPEQEKVLKQIEEIIKINKLVTEKQLLTIQNTRDQTVYIILFLSSLALLLGYFIVRHISHKIITFEIEEEKSKQLLGKANEQLTESEEKYRRLFELSEDPMWIIFENKFVMANKAASKILGYNSPDELISIHPSELSPEIQNDEQSSFNKANQMIRQAFEDGYHRFEWLYKKKNGQIFPVEVTLTKIPYFEKDALFCVWRDISNHKATEKELIDARIDAEKSAMAKGQFLATMSHEIRTPMNGVLGVAELLAETALSNEQKEYVDTISNSGQTLLYIINDILDFSKIDAGEMTLNQTDFNLEKTIKEVVNLLSCKASDKGINLNVDISSDCPIYFHADSNRLRQILFNLIGNAIKFTEKGHVTIRIKGLEQAIQKVNLLIEIEDTGIGIAPEVQKKLFSPFTQADSSTTRLYGGTGLGLSISKHLIELMGGKINLESIPQQGSTFRFSLPLSIAETEQQTTTSDVQQNTKITQGHILLVEDNLSNQKIATAMLKLLGHKITIANNGQEAVENYKNNTFDIIFMDCQMPIMGGLEATKVIRELQGKSPRVPIIALTANAMQSDRQECFDAGMDDFVSKPIMMDKLKKVVSHWIGSKDNIEH